MAELLSFARGTEARELVRRTLSSFPDAVQLHKLHQSSAPAGATPTAWAGAGRRCGGFAPIKSLRHAGRGLARNPGFAAAAILTLGLGIGATTAIFSLVNAVLLKPLAVEDPDRLVRIYVSTPEGQPYGPASHFEFDELRARDDVFEGVVAVALVVPALNTEAGRAEMMIGEMVSGDYFSVLGVEPQLGRAFRPEEDATPGTHPVVVLGHGFWTRRFGADPGIVDTTVRMNGVSFTVVGVAPASFGGLLPGISADVWAPSMMAGAMIPDVPDALTGRTSRQFMLHARLRDGVSVDRAEAAVEVVAGQLAEAFPDSNRGHVMTVVPASSVRFHPRLDGILLPVAVLLLSIVGLVPLIACANLAGLLLARASDQRKEIAVRLALGAGRGHIVRQLLGESVLLALMGGAAGVLLASWLTNLIIGFQPAALSFLSIDMGLDHRVLGFAVALSVATGVLFGLAPALQVSKPDVTRALKDEAAIVWRSRRFSLRNALLVGQVAISMLLLVVAGLFARSLQEAQTIDPGFVTDKSVVITMNAAIRYDEEAGRDYYNRLLARTAAMPSVTAVALADRLPLGLSRQTTEVLAEGEVDTPGRPATVGELPFIPIDFGRISPNYFRTLGVDLIAGHDFGPQDRQDAPLVGIVSEAAAQRLWPGESAVGKRLRRRGWGALEIVGVARDTRVRTLGEAPRPYLYVPFEQDYESAMELLLATDGQPSDLLGPAQTAILEVDPELAPLEWITMEEGNGLILFPVRMAAGLAGALGLLALLISSVGLAGSLAYSIARRMHEVGVRMAVGASSFDLVRMVIGGSMRLVVVGMVIGAVLALATTQAIAGFLVGVSPTDPTAFLGVGALLIVVAALASYIPARRAAAADPVAVLRKQ